MTQEKLEIQLYKKNPFLFLLQREQDPFNPEGLLLSEFEKGSFRSCCSPLPRSLFFPRDAADRLRVPNDFEESEKPSKAVLK